MIRIVLADDHSMVAEGFRMILDQQPDFEVAGVASSPAEAMDMLIELAPDVLVSDVSMGGQKSGLLLAERIEGSSVRCGVVLLTMHDELEFAHQAFRHGARGYVLKSSSDDDLFCAVRAAASGECHLCRELISPFIKDSVRRAEDVPSILTPHESEIAVLSVKGFSNADIAEALSVSVKTVESRKAKVMAKLGLKSKPELFDYVVRHRLF